MKKLKIQIAKWLLKKSVKWSEIEPLDFYKEFSFEINQKVKQLREIEEQEARDNFRRFYQIYELGLGKSISEQIHRLTSSTKNERFIKNN